MHYQHLRNAFVLCALLFFAAFAHAERLTSDAVHSDQADIRLFSVLSASGDTGHLPLGLHLRLRSGWKTYWRSPGDAGYPVSLTLESSSNVSGFRLLWPVPHRFTLFGLDTFGYEDEVVFPVDLDLIRPGETAEVHFLARYLVCEKICVPNEARLSLRIPEGPTQLTEDAPLLNLYRARVPGTTGPIRIADFGAQGSTLTVEAARDDANFMAPDLFIEGPANSSFSRPTVSYRDPRHVTLTVVSNRPVAQVLPLRLTLADGTVGVEKSVTAVTATTRTPISWRLLFIAFLGGLILNAMPCVLPVLLLKLTSVIQVVGREKRIMREGFLAVSAGILFSFLLLGGALIALKLAGQRVGWGIQFQQPWFLGLLIAVCLLFASNLLGWFTVPLPAFAASLPEGRGRFIANFFTGCFATLLATPCSAPFVGTAIAFALAGSTLDILTIFSAMALGLAAPYMVVAGAPRLVEFLPRPGPWMRWLKGALALSLVGTALWLATVAYRELGGSWPMGQSALAWLPYSEEEVARHVGNGETVLLDVTAQWCLTCAANERLVFGRGDVSRRLMGITLVRADWTSPSPAISRLLAAHGRYGIPLNIVYGPKAREGIVLPEILTPTAVLDALDRVR
ncbi:MAG TPA: protein-disulfide reductase DsbD domain-containing protein [Dongiaceae bacterium]|jgi:suppressor for copper-sensitivity B|nr:protein-disulfide reductase DsbD domain-containing protein [Dongiaceae bacterium]